MNRLIIYLTKTILLLLFRADKLNALKCQLVVAIVDGMEDEREVRCQVGEQIVPVDNHLDEFDTFLKSPNAEKPNFDLEFDKATMLDGTLHIPSNSKMFYDSIKSDNGTTRRGRRLGGKDPSGNQYVLVLYVIDGAGSRPSYNPDGGPGSVADNIFGTHGDPIYPGERVSLYSYC